MKKLIKGMKRLLGKQDGFSYLPALFGVLIFLVAIPVYSVKNITEALTAKP